VATVYGFTKNAVRLELLAVVHHFLLVGAEDPNVEANVFGAIVTTASNTTMVDIMLNMARGRSTYLSRS
jgi:hypothetical protein